MGLDQAVASSFSTVRQSLIHAKEMVLRKNFPAAKNYAVRAIVTSHATNEGYAYLQHEFASMESGQGHIRLSFRELNEALRLALCYAREGHCLGMKTHMLRAKGIGDDLGIELPETVYAKIEAAYRPSNINQDIPLTFPDA